MGISKSMTFLQKSSKYFEIFEFEIKMNCFQVSLPFSTKMATFILHELAVIAARCPHPKKNHCRAEGALTETIPAIIIELRIALPSCVFVTLCVRAAQLT